MSLYCVLCYSNYGGQLGFETSEAISIFRGNALCRVHLEKEIGKPDVVEYTGWVDKE